MADPRRSSRARPNPTPSQHSSSASSTSGRAERTTRSFNKSGSPQKSTPTASLSSEPPDDPVATTEILPPRTRRRVTKDEEMEQTSTAASEIEMAPPAADDMQDDDEAVRCICGEEEYPGPPSFDDLKSATKEGYNVDSVYPTDVTEDLAGFFVQCDVCKVWQHGACVGLTNDNTLPEYYYCEDCRKDLHKIFASTNGPRFSIYLPLNRSSRAPSLAKEGTRSPKSKDTKNDRLAAANHSSKRRSTMNSRDAAYDEEEQLRRAIEASKEQTSPDPTDSNLVRRTKRGREDSEEKSEVLKRPRTVSRSPSPTIEQQLGADESDEGASTKRNGHKRSRSTTVSRTQQQKAEKEEREKIRAEAASKRKGRAERRRADDSDPSEELPPATRSAVSRTTTAAEAEVTETPIFLQPTPDPTPTTTAVPSSSKAKGGGRSTHRKKGRNQYTKDRDDREGDSPTRSQSRDVQDNGTVASKAGGTDHGKSKTKAMSSKVTLTEMKRRVTAMFDYISKTQVELAGDLSDRDSRGSSKEAGQIGTPAAASSSEAPAKEPPSKAAKPSDTGSSEAEKASKEFKDLTCVEMMDFLTRDLVHWQNQYAT